MTENYTIELLYYCFFFIHEGQFVWKDVYWKHLKRGLWVKRLFGKNDTAWSFTDLHEWCLHVDIRRDNRALRSVCLEKSNLSWRSSTRSKRLFENFLSFDNHSWCNSGGRNERRNKKREREREKRFVPHSINANNLPLPEGKCKTPEYRCL